jgi:cytochrome c556
MRFLSGALVVTLGLGVVSAGVTVAAQGQRVTIAQNEAAMKEIQQNMGAMNKAIKSNDLPSAQMAAETVMAQFTLVERFWTQHKKDDAVKLASTARQGANDVIAAIKAGDQMKAQMAAGNIQGTCKQCHGLYREGTPQEGFRLKADAGIAD